MQAKLCQRRIIQIQRQKLNCYRGNGLTSDVELHKTDDDIQRSQNVY